MDASPGEEVPWDVERAMHLYMQVERYGWAQVNRFTSLRLTRQEGERLLPLIGWLEDNLPTMRAAFYAKRSRKPATTVVTDAESLDDATDYSDN